MSTSLLNANILSNLFSIVVAILILLLLVTIHEFGHYIAGRKLGFKINEFAVGFGKAIWSKTNARGEKISLRIFPLGGYCAFEGEDEEGKDESPDSFNKKEPWKRLIVQAAGATFNIISAVLFSFILLWTFGYDIMKVDQFNQYHVANPAIENALQVGDVIYKVNGENIDFSKNATIMELFSKARKADAEAPIVLTVKRDGEMVEAVTYLVPVQKEVEGEMQTVYYLEFDMSNYAQPFFEALGNTFPFMFKWIWKTISVFWLLITFRLSLSSVSGPVGMIGMMAGVTSQHLGNILVLLPILSINLAVFNLIPFPALDGMRMVFTSIEWVRRKPINRMVEAYIHFGGLVFLLLFVFLVDFIKLF